MFCVFKQTFSVFKQHFIHFQTLFHPHVFPQMFSNNNFQFLNTYTKWTPTHKDKNNKLERSNLGGGGDWNQALEVFGWVFLILVNFLFGSWSVTKVGQQGVRCNGGSYHAWSPSELPMLHEGNIGAAKLAFDKNGFALPRYPDSVFTFVCFKFWFLSFLLWNLSLTNSSSTWIFIEIEYVILE